MKAIFLTIMLFFISNVGLSKPLLIGVSPLNPPFETWDGKPNAFHGFDIDLMMEICRRLNNVCEFTPVQFNDLFPRITAGTLDLVISSVIITPTRKKNFLFSLPYMESNCRFVTRTGSSIVKPEDIAGKVVGTRLGTPYGPLAETIYKNTIKTKTFPYISDLMKALNKGEVDAVLMDNEAAKYWAYNVDDQYAMIGDNIPIGNGYGIMAALDQQQLISSINQVLLEMEQDGTYLAIYRRYFEI